MFWCVYLNANGFKLGIQKNIVSHRAGRWQHQREVAQRASRETSLPAARSSSRNASVSSRSKERRRSHCLKKLIELRRDQLDTGSGSHNEIAQQRMLDIDQRAKHVKRCQDVVLPLPSEVRCDAEHVARGAVERQLGSFNAVVR